MNGTGYDAASFSAGQDSGTRVAACVVRLAAVELVAHARWWNRWRHRLMARALVACAEELESAADASRWRERVAPAPLRPAEGPRLVAP